MQKNACGEGTYVKCNAHNMHMERDPSEVKCTTMDAGKDDRMKCTCMHAEKGTQVDAKMYYL